MRALLLPLSTLALMSCSEHRATNQSTIGPRSLSDTFDAHVHAELRKTPGNIVYSPVSVETALTMTRQGATGNTAAEIDRVLGRETGNVAAFIELGRRPRTSDGPELAIANRVYVDKASEIVPSFLDVTRERFDAPAEAVDFRSDHEAARAKINGWVEDRTSSRIKNLIPAGMIDELTRVVLINALYLNAAWKTPFDATRTSAAPFHVDGVGPKELLTMNGEMTAAHGAYAGARTLDLPYAAAGNGPRLSMLIVVPATSSLSDVEATYAREGITGFLRATSSSARLEVALPRFKLSRDFVLNDPLQKMGMKRAFDERDAELDAMSSEHLSIAWVLHKAEIEVNENGTVATAATAIIARGESATIGPPPVEFRVDRSFCFFIHDDRGTVLMMGRVLDPS